MIPYDTYTISVMNLLLFFGLIGLARPTWFIYLSGFPFFARARRRTPISSAEQRTARRWSVACLAGALLLFLMSQA